LWLEKEENATASVVEEAQEEPQEPNSQPKAPVPVSDTSQEPTPDQQQGQQTRGAELTFSGKISGVPLPVPPPDVPDGPEKVPPEGPDMTVPEPNKPSKSTAMETKNEPPEQVTGSGHPLWVGAQRAVYDFWWLIPLAAALAIPIFFVARDVAAAHKRNVRKKGHLAANASREPKRLVLRYGDKSHELGRLDRFRAIHVGPGKSNTVRTPGSTAGERYLRLYRKRNEVMLDNLATSPVHVNQVEVKPGRTQRLVIPALIQLNDKTKLKLDFVRRDSRAAQTKRKVSHAEQTEPQHVS
jgi:hypothetical protein